MLKFIKAKLATEFIGRKEWWTIGKNCEALIGFGEKLRSINIRNTQDNDITLFIAKRLDIKPANEESDIPEIRLNRTIDTFFIECSEEILKSLLEQIDYICQNENL